MKVILEYSCLGSRKEMRLSRVEGNALDDSIGGGEWLLTGGFAQGVDQHLGRALDVKRHRGQVIRL